MKTVFKINMNAEDWKTGGSVFIAKRGNGRGGSYKGGVNMGVIKAIKAVKESLLAQGRTYEESVHGDFMVITAN